MLLALTPCRENYSSFISIDAKSLEGAPVTRSSTITPIGRCRIDWIMVDYVNQSLEYLSILQLLVILILMMLLSVLRTEAYFSPSYTIRRFHLKLAHTRARFCSFCLRSRARASWLATKVHRVPTVRKDGCNTVMRLY